MDFDFLKSQTSLEKHWVAFAQSVTSSPKTSLAILELGVAPGSEAEAQKLAEHLCNDFGALNWDRSKLDQEMTVYTREERRWEWLAGRALDTRLRQKIQQKQIYISLSHTHAGSYNLLVAVGLGVTQPGSPITGVGTDIESASRVLSEDLYKRVSSAQERERVQATGLSPLELWVLKEAVFKAFPDNHATAVTEFELQSWDRPRSRGFMSSPRMMSQGLQAQVYGVFDGPIKLGFALTEKIR